MTGQAYRRAHDVVRRARGKASDHRCVTCNQRASDWALKAEPLGTLHVVRHDGKAMWFSLLANDYEPKCSADHRREDARRQAERAEYEEDREPQPYEQGALA